MRNSVNLILWFINKTYHFLRACTTLLSSCTSLFSYLTLFISNTRSSACSGSRYRCVFDKQSALVLEYVTGWSLAYAV